MSKDGVTIEKMMEERKRSGKRVTMVLIESHIQSVDYLRRNQSDGLHRRALHAALLHPAQTQNASVAENGPLRGPAGIPAPA